MTQTITLNEWTSRSGQRRRYVNSWPTLIGLEVNRHKSGAISSATVGGCEISNSAATRLLGVKVWLDDSDAVHVDYWSDGSERYATSPAAIAKAVEQALAAQEVRA